MQPVDDHATAVKLLADGLFLCMHGERPPGAPPADPTAETWARWARDTETFLRRNDDTHYCTGCGDPIRVMAFLGDGVCSVDCKKNTAVIPSSA